LLDQKQFDVSSLPRRPVWARGRSLPQGYRGLDARRQRRLPSRPGARRVLDLCGRPGGQQRTHPAGGRRWAGPPGQTDRVERQPRPLGAGQRAEGGLRPERCGAGLAWVHKTGRFRGRPNDGRRLEEGDRGNSRSACSSTRPCSGWGTLQSRPRSPHGETSRSGIADGARASGPDNAVPAARATRPGEKTGSCHSVWPTISRAEEPRDGSSGAFLSEVRKFARPRSNPGADPPYRQMSPAIRRTTTTDFLTSPAASAK